MRTVQSQTSPYEIIDVILIRYISLLTKLSLDANEIAKNILHQVVMNEISKQISLMSDNIDRINELCPFKNNMTIIVLTGAPWLDDAKIAYFIRNFNLWSSKSPEGNSFSDTLHD